MARLFQDGFEYHNSVNNYPWVINAAAAAASYVTTTVRTGTYSGQISGLTSATRAGWLTQFKAATGTGPFFTRFYINITTLPFASNTIFSYTSGTTLTATESLCVKLNSDGTLGLYNLITQIGANGSTVLATGTWYMIEVKFDSTGGAGASVGELRVNGVVERTSSTQTYAINTESFMVGGNLKAEAQTVGKWFFDDIAVNDSTGASQTGYPGSGSIVRLKPNSDGDNHQFVDATGGTAGQANNYTRVNTDGLNANTPHNGDLTSGRTDDFAMENTPSGLGNNAVINVVTVDLAAGASDVTGGQGPIKPRIKKASGGTVSSGTAFTPPNAGTIVVNRATAPWVPTLVLYSDPDGSPWTKATLDSVQAGYILSGGTGTIDTNATNVSIQVDFIPSVDYTEASTIGNTTTLTRTETEQTVESGTCTSRSTPSSAESEKFVESAVIGNKTTLSSAEIKQSVDSATIIARTTPITVVETRQSIESATIGNHTTASSAEIEQYVESSIITSRSSVISTDYKTSIEASTCVSRTTPNSNEIAQYVESAPIRTITTLSSSELYAILDANTCISSTTVSSTDLAQYVESATCNSRTTPNSLDVTAYSDIATTNTTTTPHSVDTAAYSDSYVVVSTTTPSSVYASTYNDSGITKTTTTPSRADVTLYSDIATTVTVTTFDGTEVYTHVHHYLDSATVTSTTTLIGLEVEIIVKLVGKAINRYNVGAGTHYSISGTNSRYTAGGIDTHFSVDAINHFKARVVI